MIQNKNCPPKRAVFNQIMLLFLVLHWAYRHRDSHSDCLST